MLLVWQTALRENIDPASSVRAPHLDRCSRSGGRL